MGTDDLNLPKPLSYRIGNPSVPSKEETKRWWSKGAAGERLQIPYQRAPEEECCHLLASDAHLGL